MQASPHPEETILERYAMNKLSIEDAELVENHVSLCSACLDRLDDAAIFTQNLRHVMEIEPRTAKLPNPFTSWLRLRGPVWGGLTAAVAALVLFFASRPAPLGALALVMVNGTRGTSSVAHGTGPFDFQMFMPESSPTYHVVLVDAEGKIQWNSDVAGENGKLHAKVERRLTPGQYFLRVSVPSSQSIHEYGVRIDP